MVLNDKILTDRTKVGDGLHLMYSKLNLANKELLIWKVKRKSFKIEGWSNTFQDIKDNDRVTMCDFVKHQ
jgi:hypothetical protein